MTNSTPQRAVLYARVSTQEQAERGYSLAQQLRALRDYCEREGVEVLGEYTDPGQSGAVLERPGMDALRERVGQGGVDLVLAQDLDRISREPWQYEYLKAWAADHGAAVKTLDDSGDESPMGEFVSYIRRGIAKMERDTIRQRTGRGRRQRAWEGQVLSRPPYGFKYNADRTGYEIDPATIEVVRRVFEEIASGASIRSVREGLDADGIRPAHAEKWSRVVLRQMVQDDVYRPLGREELDALAESGRMGPQALERAVDGSGIWWYGRNHVSRKNGHQRVAPAPYSEWIAVPVTPSGVPRETVDRARKNIEDNTAPSSSTGRFWEVSGILFCACGEKLATHPVPRGEGRHDFYYICTRVRNRDGECEHARYFRADETEERIRDMLRAMTRRPDVVEHQAKLHIARLRSADIAGRLKALHKHRDAILARRERFKEMYVAGAISIDELQNEMDALDKRLAAADREIADYAAREQHIERLERLAHDFVRDLPGLLDGLDDPEMAGRTYRSVYDDLGLRVTAFKDGHLEASWFYGAVTPARPDIELPPPDDPIWDGPDWPEKLRALQDETDMTRSLSTTTAPLKTARTLLGESSK